MNRYIAIIDVPQDEFVIRKFFVNYLNIGRTSEIRLNDISIEKQNSLQDCIVYFENEIPILKKYHPTVKLIKYFKTKAKTLNDLDVCNIRRYRF